MVAVAGTLAATFRIKAVLDDLAVLAGDGLGHRPSPDELVTRLVVLLAWLALVAAARLHRATCWVRTVASVAVLALANGALTVVAARAREPLDLTPQGLLVSAVGAAVGAAVWLASGLVALHWMRAYRTQLAAATTASWRAERALQALVDEEVRVRRDVAEGLHGSLQQRLVLMVARLDEVADGLQQRDAAAPGLAEPRELVELRGVRAELDALREEDVRRLSHLLYPEHLEVGLVPAVRAQLARLPASIAVELVVDDQVRRLDDPAAPAIGTNRRLLVVRMVEEAVTNAVRHGGARSVRVELAAGGGQLRLAVSDDGRGFEGYVPSSGLGRLDDRLRLVGGRIEVVSAPGAGTTVVASLPMSALVHQL